ncbi:MAG: hypothetical protein WA021_01200, partial [Minisyncoccia bacterium]
IRMTRLLTFLLIALIAFGAYVFYIERAEAPSEPVSEAPMNDARVETYVREHISELSPEPAVMGGTWYVTEIDVKDGLPAQAGRGTVWYEDGHIALIADFEYTTDKYGVTISMFEVRE